MVLEGIKPFFSLRGLDFLHHLGLRGNSRAKELSLKSQGLEDP